MSRRIFKDRMVASTATFVVTLLFAALCWLLTGMRSVENWCGFGASLLVMVSLRHMVNGNALMRIRTWMVPATFIFLSGVVWLLHPFRPVQLGVVCYALSQYYLFRAYQEYHAERQAVISFMFLGAASLFFPPLLFLAVSYYVALLVQLRALTFRTLLAGLLGLFVPLELYAAVLFFSGSLDPLLLYVEQLSSFEPLSLPSWSLVQCVNLVYVFLLFLVGCLHYSYTNFNDKIRIRMCFYIIIVQSMILYAFLALQPQHFELLLPFIVLESSPVIGHYLTFSKGKVASFFFVLTVILGLAVVAFNVWNLSLRFF